MLLEHRIIPTTLTKPSLIMTPIAYDVDFLDSTKKSIEIVYKLKDTKRSAKNLYYELFLKQVTIEEFFKELIQIVNNSDKDVVVNLYKNLLNQGLEETLESIENHQIDNPLLKTATDNYLKLIFHIREIAYSTIDENSDEYRDFLVDVIKESRGKKRYKIDDVFD